MSRLLIKDNNLVIVNYKCGFSSLNSIQELIKIKYKDIINKNFDNVFFVYRDIINRIISVFLQRCYRRFHLKTSVKLLKLLKKNMSDIEYNNFINLLKLSSKLFDNFKERNNYPINDIERKNLIEAFKIFIDNLSKIYKYDKHTISQIRLFQCCKYKLSRKINNYYYINIEKKNEIIFLEKILNIKIKKKNISNNINKNLLKNFIINDNIYKQKILTIYGRDLNINS